MRDGKIDARAAVSIADAATHIGDPDRCVAEGAVEGKRQRAGAANVIGDNGEAAEGDSLGDVDSDAKSTCDVVNLERERSVGVSAAAVGECESDATEAAVGDDNARRNRKINRFVLIVTVGDGHSGCCGQVHTDHFSDGCCSHDREDESEGGPHRNYAAE